MVKGLGFPERSHRIQADITVASSHAIGKSWKWAMLQNGVYPIRIPQRNAAMGFLRKTSPGSNAFHLMRSLKT